MNNDSNPPVAHTWLFLLVMVSCALVLLFMLTGCGSNPPQTVTVKVSVPVECREAVPDRPVMPTEQFTEKPDLHQFAKAAIAEIERREGYEVQLRAALEACTAPIQP